MVLYHKMIEELHTLSFKAERWFIDRDLPHDAAARSVAIVSRPFVRPSVCLCLSVCDVDVCLAYRLD